MSAMQPTLAPAPPHSAQDIHADNDLRAQLAAAINTSQTAHNQQHPSIAAQAQAHQASQLPPHLHGYSEAVQQLAAAANAQSAGHIDPAIAGAAHAHHALDMMNNGPPGSQGGSAAGDSGGDDGDGRKGAKRELSQSKRAAQNRAAQRAFRQRKEGYIKNLEEQVREFKQQAEEFKNLQTENYQLREYIIHLQSRLIEAHGEFPQPPPNISLSLNQHHAHQQQQQQHDPMRGHPQSQQQQQHGQLQGQGGLQNQLPLPIPQPQAQMHQQQSVSPLQAQQSLSPPVQNNGLPNTTDFQSLQNRAAQAVADLRDNTASQRALSEEYLARAKKDDERDHSGETPEEALKRQLQASAGELPPNVSL